MIRIFLLFVVLLLLQGCEITDSQFRHGFLWLIGGGFAVLFIIAGIQEARRNRKPRRSQQQAPLSEEELEQLAKDQTKAMRRAAIEEDHKSAELELQRARSKRRQKQNELTAAGMDEMKSYGDVHRSGAKLFGSGGGFRGPEFGGGMMMWGLVIILLLLGLLLVLPMLS